VGRLMWEECYGLMVSGRISVGWGGGPVLEVIGYLGLEFDILSFGVCGQSLFCL